MTQIKNKKRIWEVDVCRGVAIICVMIVHFYSIFGQFGPLEVSWHPFFYFVKQYFGAYFVFLSGLSAYLGKESRMRGLVVFGCGMAITIATTLLYQSGKQGPEILIQWGVLHLIGFCMLAYPIFKDWSPKVLILVGIVMMILGYYLEGNVVVDSKILFPLGLKHRWFYAWDYFPILPNLGWFMCGTAAGKLIYPDKKSILPKVNAENWLIRFFSWCGRHSLQIYMIHMPVFYIIATNL